MSNIKRLPSNISQAWLRLVCIVIWVGAIIIGVLIIAILLKLDGVLWLRKIDVLIYIFILINLLILNRLLRKNNPRNDKPLIWFLIGMLVLNFIWSFASGEYARQDIYDFKINLYYLLISIGLLLIPTVQNKIKHLPSYFKEIKVGLNNQLEQEKLYGRSQISNFPKRYKKISRVPGLKQIFRWGHKDGFLQVLLVFLLLTCFILIKIPYLNNTIAESPNFDKYKTYLPGLVNSYEQRDLFFNQNLYYQHLDTYDGESVAYSDFPFYAWAFFPFVPLANSISLLLLIRILMAFLDAIILLGIYLFFRKILPKRAALIGLLFLVVNGFFHNYFFVTVMGRPALLFLFFALNSCLDQNKPRAYLLAGLSILNRLSFIPIISVFFVSDIIFSKGTKKEKFTDLSNFIFLAALPVAIFSFIVKYVPLYSFSVSLSIILISILGIICAYYCVKKNYLGSMLEKSRYVWVSAIPFFGVVSYLLYKKAAYLQNAYLTDASLIFQWKMYYLILRQLENMFPASVWVLVLLGLFTGIILFSKINRKILILLTFSAIFYLISVSKAIFFHYYYRHILVITIVFLVCVFISVMPYITKKKSLNIALSVVIVFLFSVSSYSIYHKGAEKIISSDNINDYSQAIEHVKTAVKPEERILTEGLKVNAGLVLLSDRSPANFSSNIRDEIKEQGFCSAMEKYNARYFISEGKSDFRNLLGLIEKSKIKRISRADRIRYRISDEYRKKYPDTELVDIRSEVNTKEYLANREILYQRYKPVQYFKLVDTIDGFYIYKLKDCE